MPEEVEKLCINCTHAETGMSTRLNWKMWMCAAPQVAALYPPEKNLVVGMPIPLMSCASARFISFCGEEGKWFKQHPRFELAERKQKLGGTKEVDFEIGVDL